MTKKCHRQSHSPARNLQELSVKVLRYYYYPRKQNKTLYLHLFSIPLKRINKMTEREVDGKRNSHIRIRRNKQSQSQTLVNNLKKFMVNFNFTYTYFKSITFSNLFKITTESILLERPKTGTKNQKTTLESIFAKKAYKHK